MYTLWILSDKMSERNKNFPICCVCKIPVESISIIYLAKGKQYTVKCHGETETHIFSPLELRIITEIKPGLATGPGGATRRFGVTPDLVCLAKAMGGGVPCGAIGGTLEVMELIVEGDYEQVGTFNGNPLTMAAAKAVVTEILDDDAYRHFDSLRERMVAGLEEVITEFGLPAYVMAFGARGNVTFSPTPVRNYRDYVEIEDAYSHLHWLFQHNGGVFLPPWGKSEQWTLSVQHTTEDVQRFLDNFRTFAQAMSQ